jgi:N-acetylglucosamine malate deacetylase 2
MGDMNKNKPQSVIGIFAHPDDETVFAGGMAAMLVQRGIPVHFLSATRGEGGELGDPPVVDDAAKLGVVREAELRCAVEKLGVTVSFLEYIDPRVGPNDELSPFEADFDTLVEQFAANIRERKVDVVLTHGADGEYGHPAHILIYEAIVACVCDHTPEVLVYTTAANMPGAEDRILNQSQPAHFALDISPWAELKVAAMECHCSQHALFKRRRKLKEVAEALRKVESVHRIWPPVEQGDNLDDGFATVLRDAGAWTPEFDE